MPVLKIEGGDAIVSVAGGRFPEHHQLARSRERQRTQNRSINDAEDRRVGGDGSSVLYIPFKIKEKVA
jgi:hypothetical protein